MSETWQKLIDVAKMGINNQFGEKRRSQNSQNYPIGTDNEIFY